MGSLYDEFEFLEDQEGRDPVYGNDLFGWCKTHDERGELLIEEWDEYIPGTNIKKDMMSFGGMSHKKVQWKCRECGTTFKMGVDCRTSQGQNCPECGNRKHGETQRRMAAERYSLWDWCLENGEYGQRLIKEWDAEKNIMELGYGMEDLAPGTGLKVNWICGRCKEPFKSSIKHRTIHKSGCPHCTVQGTSYPELFIYNALKQLYMDAKHRSKEFDNVEYDVTIPSMNLYIEYNGGYWHDKMSDRDEYKRQLCQKNGVHLLQIFDDKKMKNNIFGEYEIRYKNDVSKQDQQLKEIVEYIVKMLGDDICEIDFKQAIEKAGQMAYNEVEWSFCEDFPELKKEWLPELNNGLRPECFTAGSHQEIVWKCSRCTGLWRISIHSRTGSKTGCPRCGYNVFDKKIHVVNGNQRRLVLPRFGANNL